MAALALLDRRRVYLYFVVCLSNETLRDYQTRHYETTKRRHEQHLNSNHKAAGTWHLPPTPSSAEADTEYIQVTLLPPLCLRGMLWGYLPLIAVLLGCIGFQGVSYPVFPSSLYTWAVRKVSER
jgi:hypothetical protein